MRSTRPQKRKASEVSGEQYELKIGAVEKYIIRTGRRNWKSAAEKCEHVRPEEDIGVVPRSSVQLSDQKFPNRSNPDAGTIKLTQSEPPSEQQSSSAKIDLQLFPTNETTRLGLEKDGYNPFLELTLSARKKISSVIKHLNRKWGTSSVAIGQLMLFPYHTKSRNALSCRGWTSNDSSITSGQVYVAVGSPSIFRLRYGWDCYSLLKTSGIPQEFCAFEDHMASGSNRRCWSSDLGNENDQDERIKVTHEDIKKPIDTAEDMGLGANELQPCSVPEENVDAVAAAEVGPLQSMISWDNDLTNLSIGGLLSEISLQQRIKSSDLKSANESRSQPTALTSDISIGALLSEASLQGKIGKAEMKLGSESGSQPILLPSSDISISGLLAEASLLSTKSKLKMQQTEENANIHYQSSWDDNLTNLGIGGLLSEASLQGKVKEMKSSLQPNAVVSDSFDAFATEQLNMHSQVLKPTCNMLSSSILDAEETCHAFPIQNLQQSSKDPVNSNERSYSERSSKNSSLKPFRSPKNPQANEQSSVPKDSCQQPKKSPSPSVRGFFDEDSSLGLSGIKWNDSLGPFDLGLPSKQVTAGESFSLSEIVR